MGQTSATATTGPGRWLLTAHEALQDVSVNHPLLFYGTDWLAFGHFVIAIAFVGALRDPVRDQARMLVTQVAALGEAAHVEDRAAVLEVQACAGAADHRRRVPLRLHAPAVQDRVAFVAHAFVSPGSGWQMCAMRTSVRIAHHRTND